MDMWCLHFLWS